MRHTTGHTALYLRFRHELRIIDDVVRDLKAVLDKDNFVPWLIDNLKRLTVILKSIKKRVEMKQDQRKQYYNKNRQTVYFTSSEKAWVVLHPVSKDDRKKIAKLVPKRDGPY